jgi:hypothetical protein
MACKGAGTVLFNRRSKNEVLVAHPQRIVAFNVVSNSRYMKLAQFDSNTLAHERGCNQWKSF